MPTNSESQADIRFGGAIKLSSTGTGFRVPGDAEWLNFTLPKWHREKGACYCADCAGTLNLHDGQEVHGKANARRYITHLALGPAPAGWLGDQPAASATPAEPQDAEPTVAATPAVFDRAAVERITRIAALDRAIRLAELRPAGEAPPKSADLLAVAQRIYTWLMTGEAG